MASTYGLITRVIRQTVAAFHSASMSPRFLRKSRKASSATSSPILLRWLGVGFDPEAFEVGRVSDALTR